MYDGQFRDMIEDEVTVTVKTPAGTLEPRTRTLYSTHHGPVFNGLAGVPLPWTSATAFTMGDANAENFRYLNHFFETNLAQSTRRARHGDPPQPGDPLGQHDRRGLRRQGLLRRHLGDAERARTRRRPTVHLARRGRDVPGCCGCRS